ncbi:MAG: AMIN domain-containing protein, partial [Steroidobacteraceae bacterium]
MKRHCPTRSCTVLALSVAALALGALGAPLRAADDSRALQSIDVQPLAGEHVRLTLHLSAPAPQPRSFTIASPASISIDLPNTTLALPSRHIDVHSAGLDTVLAAQGKDRSRIVLNLDKMLPYTTRVSGNDVIVLLGGNSSAASGGASAAGAGAADSAGGSVGGSAGSSAAQPATTASLSYSSGAVPGPRSIRSIDFHRTSDGGGRVIVDLTDPHTSINLRQVGSKIVVDFADTAVPQSLERHYDATDFGTPITGF